MNVENQVTSIGPSKELTELGIKREGVLCGITKECNDNIYLSETAPTLNRAYRYTVHELLEMLPDELPDSPEDGTVNLYKDYDSDDPSARWWCANYECNSVCTPASFDTVSAKPADALAKLLIWCIKEGHVNVEDINAEAE